jgi:hypothetical protein
MASRKAEKERLRQERMARERQLADAARRRRLFQFSGLGAAAVIAAVVVVVIVLSSGSSAGSNSGSNGTNASSHNWKPILKTTSTTGLTLKPAPSSGPIGPEGIPVPTNATPLASNASGARGRTVDGVSCGASEQVAFHVHTHLTIFVNGVQRQIPYGIGIVPPRQVQTSATGPFVVSGSCFYWLHTHAADGIIHIESPVVRTYTLGDFFDIWGQPIGPDQVGPAKGKVTAFYNGKKYIGNPGDMPIGDHVQIQLDVGTPLVAPENVSFTGTQL